MRHHPPLYGEQTELLLEKMDTIRKKYQDLNNMKLFRRYFI